MEPLIIVELGKAWLDPKRDNAARRTSAHYPADKTDARQTVGLAKQRGWELAAARPGDSGPAGRSGRKPGYAALTHGQFSAHELRVREDGSWEHRGPQGSLLGSGVNGEQVRAHLDRFHVTYPDRSGGVETFAKALEIGYSGDAVRRESLEGSSRNARLKTGNNMGPGMIAASFIHSGRARNKKRPPKRPAQGSLGA